MRQDQVFNAVCVLGAIFLVALVLAIAGCGRIMDLDRQFWAGDEGPVDPNTGQPTHPPDGWESPGGSLLQLLAGGLAIGGYGGLANWIRVVKKRSNGELAALQARVQILEGDMGK